MVITKDLLLPISSEHPGGADLRYGSVYDQIREARRQDDDLAQGAWQRDRKLADWSQVRQLAENALTGKSKDLQVAAWLTEALLKLEGFAGLHKGLATCRGLLETFWDALYPLMEDGDLELRAAPLEWIGTRLDGAVRMAPIVGAGYGWYKHKESRNLGYEDEAKTDAQKKGREKLLKEGKLAPEEFDKTFRDTPKSFYTQAESDIELCRSELRSLESVCDREFGNAAPGFGKLGVALEEVLHTVHALLEKKRETEPDPDEQPAAQTPPAEAQPDGTSGQFDLQLLKSDTGVVSCSTVAREQGTVVDSLGAIAASIRKRDPGSPAPYLMLRGLRWGELRAAMAASDPSLLEAPPIEYRQQIKTLALAARWQDLLEAAETMMASPWSRAWLDLQRYVVNACVALGERYFGIAVAIRSELRALLRDFPQLADASLMDDTPAANAETKLWFCELLDEPNVPPDLSRCAGPARDSLSLPGWQKRFVDRFEIAKQALRSGEEQKAFEILNAELARQHSGRGRFERRLQLVQLCLSAGKEALAQPILDDIITAIDTHKLEDWEDREAMASALLTVVRASKRIQGDPKEKQKYFERICRLDPVQALAF